MSSADDSILSDFLLEANDLIGGLGAQLISLEGQPRDTELLNAVFRVFHTVKGGAGFLGIEPIIALCHRAEDLLNAARRGICILDANAVDTLLTALDYLQRMMQALGEGQPPQSAPSELLQMLQPPDTNAAAKPSMVVSQDVAKTTDPVDVEFETVSTAFHVLSGHTASDTNAISDDEFEALLDSLHGTGAVSGAPANAENTQPPPLAKELTTVTAHDPSTPIVSSAVKESKAAVTSTASQVETTIRVDTGRLDTLMNYIGELVLVRNRLGNFATTGVDEVLERIVGELDRVTNNLQTAVMRTRMQPVGRLFARFPRITRDLARQLGKELNLVLEGEDTDLDRSLVEALADPLVHLVRNALDHGIETPNDRERTGKPRAGKLRLTASQQGEHIIIAIHDDGRGMDPAVLRQKAIEKNMLTAERAKRLSDEESFDLIFMPGFSTRNEISDVSGRGVGMDVVKTRVSELGGTIVILSRPGVGTEIRVSLPLTLAILRALMVRVGGRLLALPLANVAEVFELDAQRISMVDGREVISYRTRPLPLCYMQHWLALKEEHSPVVRQHVVVVHIGHQRIGCVVQEVVGRQEIVIKPLGALLRDTPGIAGATITGDGRVALIVDLVGLLKISDSFPHPLTQRKLA